MEVTTVSSIVEDEDLDHSMNEEVGVDSIEKFYQLVLHTLWCINLSKSASRTAEKRTKMLIMSAETKQFSQRIPVQRT
jgi:hypothetical protein